MSILIKGMEMPSNCDECKLRNGMGKDHGKAIYHCAPLAKWVVPNPLGRADDCPLIEVPPHGRLIDADALMKDGWYLHKQVMGMSRCATHELPLNNPSIPTIIESTIGQLNSDSAVNEAEEGE